MHAREGRIALRWAVEEMEKRKALFAKLGVFDIESYNARNQDQSIRDASPKKSKIGSKEFVVPEQLPYLVIVMDAFEDMVSADRLDNSREIELAAERLASCSPNLGVHLIISTQSANKGRISSVLKAAIQSRVSFFVSSPDESSSIFGERGAENLSWPGEFFFRNRKSSGLNRAHAALVSGEEICRLVDFASSQDIRPGKLLINHELYR
jgi:S-DNA-T family DNA segregation ATPase FtsK/SpoIIIE